jgi:hypothetical protein
LHGKLKFLESSSENLNTYGSTVQTFYSTNYSGSNPHWLSSVLIKMTESVLAMIQGDKDAKSAWRWYFRLKKRGLDQCAVQLGIMMGFQAYQKPLERTKGQVARCWIHKNACHAARRYQAVQDRLGQKHANGRIEATSSC